MGVQWARLQPGTEYPGFEMALKQSCGTAEGEWWVSRQESGGTGSEVQWSGPSGATAG